MEIFTKYDELSVEQIAGAQKEIFSKLKEEARKVLLQRKSTERFVEDNLVGLESLTNWIIGYEKIGEEFKKINRYKGLWFVGGCGTGKTLAMQAFSNLLSTREESEKHYFCFKRECDTTPFHPVYGVPIIQAREIESQYYTTLTHNEVFIFPRKDNSGYRTDNPESLLEYYKKVPLLIVDDLGAEYGEINYFGTKINVLEELLSRRYDYNVTTFVTTNIANPNEYYSERIYSRITEMFKSVILNGADLRIMSNR